MPPTCADRSPLSTHSLPDTNITADRDQEEEQDTATPITQAMGNRMVRGATRRDDSWGRNGIARITWRWHLQQGNQLKMVMIDVFTRYRPTAHSSFYMFGSTAKAAVPVCAGCDKDDSASVRLPRVGSPLSRRRRPSLELAALTESTPECIGGAAAV